MKIILSNVPTRNYSYLLSLTDKFCSKYTSQIKLKAFTFRGEQTVDCSMLHER